ncbi:hypothetical protein BDV24DRAFT_164606 [Aspergillus arachidicola]|uniref:Uncharacterized protein n=1 Tax=Aspergillus arachidicola TaxID=656916 RepID=A0A5N6Y3W1_9EURO|nr:hypothetical protein BDV24DRAFT_164606 [Aspergillus arachidicola]
MPAVKDLMNKEEPPTFEDLLATPWKSTRQLGVYLKPIFLHLDDTASDHFVYTGSAIMWYYTGGLNHRCRQHENKPGPKRQFISQYYYRLRATVTIIRSGCTPQVTRTSYSPRFSGIHAWGFINCTKWGTCFSWTSK